MNITAARHLVKSSPSRYGQARSILDADLSFKRFFGLYEDSNRWITKLGNSDWFYLRDHAKPSAETVHDAMLGKTDDLYGARAGEFAHYALLDIDADSIYHTIDKLGELRGLLQSVGLNSCHYRSSSSEGWHLVIPFTEWTNSAEAHGYLVRLLSAKGWTIAKGTLEVFPSNNAIRLPFQPGWMELDPEDAAYPGRPLSARLDRFLLRLRQEGSDSPAARARIESKIRTNEIDFRSACVQTATDLCARWQRGHDYYHHGLTAPGQTHDAMLSLSYYLWQGDKAAGVPSLRENDLARAAEIFYWLQERHNGFCQLLNNGKWQKIQSDIERIVSWRPKGWTQFDDSTAELRAEKRITPEQMRWGNLKRHNEAYRRIYDAIQALRKAGKKESTKAIAEAAGACRKTVAKYRNLQSGEANNSLVLMPVALECPAAPGGDSTEIVCEASKQIKTNLMQVESIASAIVKSDSETGTNEANSMSEISFTIQDFLGVRKAECTVNEGDIILVGGRNGAGKSSLLTALQCLVLGLKMPNDEPEKIASTMLNYKNPQAVMAYAYLHIGDEKMKTVWSKTNKIERTGSGLKLHAISAGKKTLFEMTKKQRAETLIPLLKAAPSKEQTLEALEEVGMLLDDAIACQESISKSSFEFVWKQKEQEGIIDKRRFQDITRLAWGTDQFERFVPTDSGLIIANLEREDYVAAVTTCAGFVEEALKAQAVKDAGNEENKKWASRVVEFQDDLAALKDVLKEYECSLPLAETVLKGHRQALKRDAFLSCPCCTAKLEHVGDKLIEYSGIKKEMTDAEYKELQVKHDGADLKLKTLNQQILDQKAAIVIAIADLKKAEQCQALIMKAEGHEKKEAPSASVENARMELDKAKRALQAFDALHNAREVDTRIKLNEKVKRVLAPDGLQKKVLTDALGDFNARLHDLSHRAKWGRALVHEDMAVTYEEPQGKPCENYRSGSEELRRNILLQIAVAQVVGDKLVLIDCGDLLNSADKQDKTTTDAKGELMTLIKYSGLTAVVAMMVPGPGSLPDLRARGAGATLWMKSGVSQEIGLAVAK